MKAIKRFNSSGLSEIFGLAPSSGSFIFKPADNTQVSYPEPHRKEMFSLGSITSGSAELRVGLSNYQVQAPGLVAIGPDEVRQWVLNQSDIKITGLFFTDDFAIAGLADALFLNTGRKGEVSWLFRSKCRTTEACTSGSSRCGPGDRVFAGYAFYWKEYFAHRPRTLC